MAAETVPGRPPEPGNLTERATYSQTFRVSKPIRYDSLLVRDLAAELNEALARQQLFAVRVERDARLLELETAGANWRWALHPLHGELLRAPRLRLDGNVLLPRRARVEGVVSLPDERILAISVTGDDDGTHGGTAQRILVELLTNQWNALALAAGDRITQVLHPRVSRTRKLESGEIYAAPEPTGRAGIDAPVAADEWREIVGGAPAGSRVRTFIARIAWASPLNAAYVIGAAEARDDAVDDAYTRYLALVEGTRSPCVLPAPDERQPYGVRLDPDARVFPSLLDAFAAAVETPVAGAGEEQRAAALANAGLQASRAAMKAKRLRAQLEKAPGEAAALRRIADLLLAQIHRVPKGAARVLLDDFEGGTIDVALDATLSPPENATEFYTQARKRERAADRLPGLIERAEREAKHWRGLHERIDANEASTQEIRDALPAPPQRDRRARREVTLPYRVYRTTSGLEVRVGRNPRANDALTLRHASGNDIWLHAREVGGAHVVLRWTDREANPSHRDIEEAATLAALHSKARTSKLVPVDYTRRKYVRKPRKSPPGRVTFERGKTVFVEPDAELAEAMRVRVDEGEA